MRCPTLPACVILLAALLALPALAAPSAAEELASAGRLRTQAQRLAKLWLQAGLDIQADSARRELRIGIAQGERELARLETAVRRDDARRTLARARSQWEALRAALETPYGAIAAARLIDLAEELTRTAGKLALQIEQAGESADGRLLDLSLRQNMLAQRLARLYLQAQAGDRSESRLVDLEQTRREFAAALDTLASAPDNRRETRDALELARGQWIFFELAVVDLARGARSHPQHVASTSERLLQVLDTVSAQYGAPPPAPVLAALPAASRPN